MGQELEWDQLGLSMEEPYLQVCEALLCGRGARPALRVGRAQLRQGGRQLSGLPPLLQLCLRSPADPQQCSSFLYR